MTADSALRAQRSEHSGTDVTCSRSNEGYNDEHRNELQRLLHRDWPRRVEGSVGASGANTSNPRGLCIGRFSEFARTRPKFPPTRSVTAKTAVAHRGLNSVETNPSSQFSRIAVAAATRILAQTDRLKLLGKFGIGRSEIVLRCRFSSDSSILSIQTI